MIQRVLFVCSGNTCRTPMAAVLFRDLVAKDATYRESGMEARSAGTTATGGEPAAELAVSALRHRGVELGPHRATGFSQEVAAWADVILTMTEAHRRAVVQRAPAAGPKTFTIASYAGGDGDVEDPLDQGTEAYERCAVRLSELMPRVAARMCGLGPTTAQQLTTGNLCAPW